MIHGTLAFLSIMGVLPSSPWLHFQNEGVSLEWVKNFNTCIQPMCEILYTFLQ